MTDRRAVSACVLCAFALSPAASAFAQGGGAAAPPSVPTAVTSAAPLAQTAEQRAALNPDAGSGGAAAPDAPAPADQPNTPAGDAAVAAAIDSGEEPPAESPSSSPVASQAPASDPAVLRTAPKLRPVQSAGDTVEVPVPRPQAAPAPTASAITRLPMTGFDLGVSTSLGLALIGAGLVVRGLVQPRGRSVTV